jgi:23S rRNA pseudouridine2605 synthase
MKLSVKEVDKKQRLQVALSRSGLCSRRKAMNLILQGRVSVNGNIVREPSVIVAETDKIFLDGIAASIKKYEYILLNKPKDYITTLKDRYAKHTVMELLPEEYRHLYPAGRLDQDTEGLLLFTNDGNVAFHLTHPKFNINKTYFVKIKGCLTSKDKTTLEEGIVLEGKRPSPAKGMDVHIKEDLTHFYLTIHEGRKRQIRQMLGKRGYLVVELKRVSQGPLKLGDLKTGSWRKLTAEEISTLKKLS